LTSQDFDKEAHNMTHGRELDQQAVYQIRVKGNLDQKWSPWFDGFAITPQANDETILTGPVADQAALHGLLAKIRDLGLPLLSVARDKVAEEAKQAPVEKHSQEKPK
jgi:hypothetical protein